MNDKAPDPTPMATDLARDRTGPGVIDDTNGTSTLALRKRCMVWVRTGPAESDRRMISAEFDPMEQVIHFEGNSQIHLGDAQIERIAVASPSGGMATMDIDLEDLKLEADANGQMSLRWGVAGRGDEQNEEDEEEARRVERERRAARRHPGYLDDGMDPHRHP